MAKKFEIDIAGCFISTGKVKLKKKVDSVKFCTKDATTYYVSGLSKALPTAPDPIPVGPSGCTPDYPANGPIGDYTATVTGANCLIREKEAQAAKKAGIVIAAPVIIIEID